MYSKLWAKMAGGAVKKVPHTRAIGPFYARYSLLNLGSSPPSFLLNAPRAGNRFDGLRRGTERERGESSGDTQQQLTMRY